MVTHTLLHKLGDNYLNSCSTYQMSLLLRKVFDLIQTGNSIFPLHLSLSLSTSLSLSFSPEIDEKCGITDWEISNLFLVDQSMNSFQTRKMETVLMELSPLQDSLL